jgi:voltage-gated potassium channel
MNVPAPTGLEQLGGTEGRSPEAAQFGCPPPGLRRRLFVTIFESDTPAGRAFDLALLVLILASVTTVMLDSMDAVSERFVPLFDGIEWFFTILFTVEYLLRLYSVERPAAYARSFLGLVDLMAVLPTYLMLVFPGAAAGLNIRALRVLRVFRILKLVNFIHEYRALGRALRNSARKIFVFIITVILVVMLLGSAMYLIEGPANGFTSIPVSIYWAITTVTTVGFGDIAPKTGLGRVIASFMMLLGWGILAVPTGIVTAEMAAERFGQWSSRLLGGGRRCAACGSGGHRDDAKFCYECGGALGEAEPLGSAE